MKKTLSIAAVALMVAGSTAFACGSCGCETKTKDKAKSECGSCKGDKVETACGGSKKADKEQTACGGSEKVADKNKAA